MRSWELGLQAISKGNLAFIGLVHSLYSSLWYEQTTVTVK